MQIKGQANNPIYVIKCLLQGFKLLNRTELRQFILLPIFINLILYSIAFVLGYFYLSSLIAQFIPNWLLWLEWIIFPLFFSGFSIAGFFTFVVIANLIASPFYPSLAAKTLNIISAQDNLIKTQTIRKTVFSEFKRILYLFSKMLPLLLLFFIPVINLFAPVLWVLFCAWGIGLEFMAYPLENQGILFTQQKDAAKTRKVGVLVFGGLIIVGLAIPFINLIIAPASVIATTIYFYGIAKNPET